MSASKRAASIFCSEVVVLGRAPPGPAPPPRYNL